MKNYMSDESRNRYIPANQRNMIETFKKYSIFEKLNGDADKEISGEFNKIINHLKVSLCMTPPAVTNH